MSVKSTCLWTTLSVPVTLASTHRSERHARRVLGGRGLLRGGSLPGRVLSRWRTPRGTRPQAASSSSRDPAVLLPQPPVCSLMRPRALFPLLPCTFKLKSFLILNLGIVARIVQRAAMHHPPRFPAVTVSSLWDVVTLRSGAWCTLPPPGFVHMSPSLSCSFTQGPTWLSWLLRHLHSGTSSQTLLTFWGPGGACSERGLPRHSSGLVGGAQAGAPPPLARVIGEESEAQHGPGPWNAEDAAGPRPAGP